MLSKVVELMPEEALQKLQPELERRPKLKMFVEIALATGLRISEILSLDIENLTYIDEEFQVKKWIRVWVKGGWVADTCLPDVLREKIRDYIINHRRCRIGPLFNRYRYMRARMTRQGMYEYFRSAQIDAGIHPLYHPHQLRHSFGTMIAERTNGDVYTIAAMMHHRDLRSSMVYVHVNRNRIEQIANTL